MDNGSNYIILQSIWPDPNQVYVDVREAVLPKAFEFFGALTTVLVVALIVRSLRS